MYASPNLVQKLRLCNTALGPSFKQMVSTLLRRSRFACNRSNNIRVLRNYKDYHRVWITLINLLFRSEYHLSVMAAIVISDKNVTTSKTLTFVQTLQLYLLQKCSSS